MKSTNANAKTEKKAKKTTPKKNKKLSPKTKIQKGPRIIKGKDPTLDEVIKILQLPDNQEGRDRLDKMIASFGPEFTYREKLFVLFYTSPNSLTCGNIAKSGQATGGSWCSYGDWARKQPHVKKAIETLINDTTLETIEDFFREDIAYNIAVIRADRTNFRKDDEWTDEENDKTYENIKDKPLYLLTDEEKKLIKDFTYDKMGNAHYVIESRQEARQALAVYHKLFKAKKDTTDSNKQTETVVTLEAIKGKAVAKVSVIQKNNEDADKAGDFFEPMSDQDEEA